MADEVRYRVSVDFERFKQIYIAQNRAYLRKVGIGGVIVGVPLTVISAMLTIQEFDTQWLLLLVAMLLLTVYSVFCIARPIVFFGTRKNEVYGFFARHETPIQSGQSLESLSCVFDVTVCEYGFELTMQDGNTVHLPWFSLSGRSEKMDFGQIFLGDDGKNSSYLYNMLGENALLREGMETEPLVVPTEAETAHPGLTDEIARRIADSRTKFGKHGNAKQTPEAQALAAWLEADSVK